MIMMMITTLTSERINTMILKDIKRYGYNGLKKIQGK